MNEHEIDEHIARIRRLGNDDEHVEAKAATQKLPKGIWESVSAFANTNGGLVLLGLDEANGFAPAQGFDPRATLDRLRSKLDGAPGATPAVSPVPTHDLGTHNLDGTPVVWLWIAPMLTDLTRTMPCHVTIQGIERGSYKRVGDADKHLSPYEVYLLQSRHREDHTDRETVPGRTIDDLSPEAVRSTLDHLRRTSRALTGLTDNDLAAGLARVNAMDGGVPTLAGYLALGVFPQQEFPQLTIDVAVHLGTAKSTDPHARFKDRKVCDGPLPVAIRDAVDAIAGKLGTRRVVTGVGGTDVPEIPLEVLREAVTNAVMHRDYSTRSRGQQVAVDIYPDRVEVTSPGGFWGTRTKDNVTEGQSSSRNGDLVRLLTAVPLPGENATVAENQGSGVPLMVASMRKAGLPAPDYSRSDIDKVVLRLDRRTQSPSPVMTKAQQEVLDHLDDFEAKSIHDLAQATGRTPAALRPVLRELVDTGAVEATAPPQSRNRRYRLGHA